MDNLLSGCMDVLRAIATIRTPTLDIFFSAVTRLGEETLFIALALLFFWCIDKRKGYYLLYVGLVGTTINGWLKILFCVPRPWVLDPKFKIVESARAAASGFSFPSGHTQSIAGSGFSVARAYRKPLIKVISIVVVLLVAFSRMYLGVHTPLDVVVSLVIALVLALTLYPAFCKAESDKRIIPLLLGGLFMLTVCFLLYMSLAPLQVARNDENIFSGLKNAYVFVGTSAGFAAVYFFEAHFVNFRTDAPWWAQIIKFGVGLGILLGIKSALKEPLLTLLDGSGFSHSIRYFIAIFIGGGLYPMLFRFLPQKKVLLQQADVLLP